MKVTSFLVASAIAVSSYAAAVPEANPEAAAHCRLPGQYCGRSEITELEAREADPHCRLPGQYCGKEKRAYFDSLVVRSCGMAGQPCHKLARAAEAAAEALAAPAADPAAHTELFVRHCRLPGQYCGKAKRSAEALAEAIAKAYADAFPNPEAMAEACSFGEVACEKIKRAAEAEADPHCRLPGQYCGKAKREAWAEAAAALAV